MDLRLRIEVREKIHSIFDRVLSDYDFRAVAGTQRERALLRKQ